MTTVLTQLTANGELESIVLPHSFASASPKHRLRL